MGPVMSTVSGWLLIIRLGAGARRYQAILRPFGLGAGDAGPVRGHLGIGVSWRSSPCGLTNPPIDRRLRS